MHMPLHILQILSVMLSKQHRQNIPFQIGPFHLLLVLFVHPVYGGPLCYLAQNSSQFLSLHRLQYIVHTVLLDCLSGKSKVAVTAQNHEISLRNLLGAYHIQQFQPAHQHQHAGPKPVHQGNPAQGQQRVDEDAAEDDVGDGARAHPLSAGDGNENDRRPH